MSRAGGPGAGGSDSRLSSCLVTSHPADVLDDLVASGRESGGAVAVVRDGVLEVDACAGTSDGVAPWRADTLVMTFSVAKPFAALAALDVVADGRLGLDEPVASVWPAYARAGKEHTTLRHVLSHQAGLPTFPEEAAHIAYDDREALVDLLAGVAPIHPPGAGVAEHALTYGHLLDEIVRRATGEHLAERFARIASENGWDLHLRVAEPDLGRVATLVDPDGAWASGYRADPRWGPALGRPRGLLEPDVLNSPRFRRTSFPAVALHATALALALPATTSGWSTTTSARSCGSSPVPSRSCAAARATSASSATASTGWRPHSPRSRSRACASRSAGS